MGAVQTLPAPPAEAPFDRKLFGAFYTPEELAAVLVAWVYTGGPGRLLDPSFGDGVFLEAAADYCREQGWNNEAIVGIDTAPGALHGGSLRSGAERWVKITGDFLSLEPVLQTGGTFRYVVGNPPYVRHHRLLGAQRSSADAVFDRLKVKVSRRSNLWGYFVVHALRFLDPDGRLAFVLPRSAMDAEYAAPIRRMIEQRFARVAWVELRERVFEGTDEVALVLVADSKGERSMTTARLGDIGELRSWMERWEAGSSAVAEDLHAEASDLCERVSRQVAVRRFSEFASIAIGRVTGGNEFFIHSRSSAQARGIAENELSPCLSATRHLSGVRFTSGDAAAHLLGDERVCLLNVSDIDNASEGARTWLERGEKTIGVRTKCRSRTPWYRVPMGTVPEAFATCASPNGPALVLNEGGWRCTNTVHEVRWRDGEVEPRWAIVAAQTSFVQVQAELIGRSYGGGLLKTDPGHWTRLRFPVMPFDPAVLTECDRLIRAGARDAARRRADQELIKHCAGAMAVQAVYSLETMLKRLRHWRLPDARTPARVAITPPDGRPGGRSA